MRRLGQEQAQGVVEFALLIMVLLLVLLGAVDYGRFLYYSQTINNAARVGELAAINHCISQQNCGLTSTGTPDAWIIQDVVCEAAPTVALNPEVSTCGVCLAAYCTSDASCTAVNGAIHVNDYCSNGCNVSCAQQICKQDICTVPSDPPPGTPRNNGTDVSVIVGYNFQPIAPLMDVFFQQIPCWTGDSTPHTLCSRYNGKIA